MRERQRQLPTAPVQRAEPRDVRAMVTGLASMKSQVKDLRAESKTFRMLLNNVCTAALAECGDDPVKLRDVISKLEGLTRP